MCPPTRLGEVVWGPILELQRVEFTPQGTLQTHFRSRPGVTYTIECADTLSGTVVWHAFRQHGSVTATATASVVEDDFTPNPSGGPAATGMRFYRFQYNGTP